MANKRTGKVIGEVSVDVTANTDQATQAMSEVQNSAENMASGVDTQAQNASKSMNSMSRNMTDSLSRAAGPILGLLGSVTALVGVFKLFFDIGNKVGNMLAGTAEAAEVASKAIKQMADDQASANKLLDEGAASTFAARRIQALKIELEDAATALAKADEELTKGETGIGATILGAVTGTLDSIRQAQAELAQEAEAAEMRLQVLLEERAGILARGSEESKAAAAEEAAEGEQADFTRHRNRLRQLDVERNALEVQTLGPVAAARRKAELDIEAVRRRIREAETELDRKRLQEILEFTKEIGKANIEEAQKLVRLQEKADKDRRDRERQRVDANTQRELAAQKSIAAAKEKALTASFDRQNQRLEQMMGTLNIAAERIAASVDQVKRRVNP